jgi:AraC-like DNA-binding protein
MDTQLAIPAISSRLGYASRFKFERSFKKQFGLTPTQYRKHSVGRTGHLQRMATQGIDKSERIGYRAPRVQKQDDADRY